MARPRKIATAERSDAAGKSVYVKRKTASARYRDEQDGRRAGEDADFLQKARDRFKLGQDATKEQRERELEDLRFYAGDQWPAAIRQARDGSPGNPNNGTPPVPARPCITINKTREPVKQVLNQERQSDMGAEIVPADDFGGLVGEVDDTEIELREGLLRRIQRAPETSDAITWAFARAVQCGTGWFGIMTRYLKGMTFDQEPYVCRFYNQAEVTVDPSHEQPDASDIDWGFVGSYLPWDEYKAQYPHAKDGSDNPLCAYNDDQFTGLGAEAPGWFTVDKDGKKFCRVVDYYYTERTSKTLALLEDGSTLPLEDVPEGVKPLQTRVEVEKSIKWCKLDGCQVLDETDWPGPDIPLIKVLGEELQPYDQERRAEGMVRPAIESNRGENYMISKLVETIGLAPIPPLMVASGQDEGFEVEYQQMNTRTLGVLHYNTKDADGNVVGPPTRPPVDTQIGPMVTAVQYFAEATKNTTGVPDSTLGNVDPSLKSGRAIKLLQQQSQLGTSNYLDNLARSVRRMGVILNGLFYPLYSPRPGRLARIVNGEGESETAVINPADTQGQPQVLQANQRVFKLSKDAHFNVNIKVVPNKETRRDAESSALGELIAANPEFMGWFGDKYLRNLDIPDHKELAERAKVMLAPPIQSMLAAKERGQAEIPPQVQQQLAKAGEVIKGLSETNEQLVKDAETEAAKQRAETERQQMADASKAQIAQINAQVKLAVEQLKADLQKQLEGFRAAQATETREDEQRHEMALKAAEAAQAKADAEEQREHEAQMGRQAHESAELQGERGHEQAIEMQERAPKPTTNE